MSTYTPFDYYQDVSVNVQDKSRTVQELLDMSRQDFDTFYNPVILILFSIRRYVRSYLLRRSQSSISQGG